MSSLSLSNRSLWLLLAAFVAAALAMAWCRHGAASVHSACHEDGPVEAATAFAFAGAAWLFARRSFAPRPEGSGPLWRPLLRLGAATMVLFVGEEISWGQRLLGFASPEPLRALNAQSEVNFHNLHGIQQLKYSLLVATLVLLIATAAVAPLCPPLARLAWRRGVPLLPLAAAPFLLVALAFVRRLADWLPLAHRNDAQELGELFFALGLFAFAGACGQAPAAVRSAAPTVLARLRGAASTALRAAPRRRSARW